MSEEQLKAFLEKVKANSNLQEKLKAAADSDAVLAIAKEAGFSISADDLTMAQSKLSEEELEGAAGGTSPATPALDLSAARPICADIAFSVLRIDQGRSCT